MKTKTTKQTTKIDTRRMISEVHASGGKLRGFGFGSEPTAEEKRATLVKSIAILQDRMGKEITNRALPGLLAFHEAQLEALDGKIGNDIATISARSQEIKAERLAKAIKDNQEIDRLLGR